MNRLNEVICFDGQAYNLRRGTVADVEYNRFWNSETGKQEQKVLPNQDCRTCKMTDKNCEECQKRIFTDIIVHKSYHKKYKLPKLSDQVCRLIAWLWQLIFVCRKFPTESVLEFNKSFVGDIRT